MHCCPPRFSSSRSRLSKNHAYVACCREASHWSLARQRAPMPQGASTTCTRRGGRALSSIWRGVRQELTNPNSLTSRDILHTHTHTGDTRARHSREKLKFALPRKQRLHRRPAWHVVLVGFALHCPPWTGHRAGDVRAGRGIPLASPVLRASIGPFLSLLWT